MKKIDWKKANWQGLLPYGVAIVVFLVIAMCYCAPVFNGKVLTSVDTNLWKGGAQESLEYAEKTGETTWWTNSMFGGMPTIQVSGKFTSTSWMQSLHTVVDGFFVGDKRPVGLIFAYFIGFFLMLLCFGVHPWLSLIGGLAMGLSSYFFLIIPVGHLSKADALCLLAPMVGGAYAIFRKRYGLGIPVVLLSGMLSVTLHPQMTYYVGLLMVVLAMAELYIHIREQRWKDLGIGVGILLVCSLLIFGTKYSWWQMNQSYLQETMRGGHSDLSASEEFADESEMVSGGLDIDYATAWSYGKAETFTLLIPNLMGGSSSYDVGNHSVLYEQMVHSHVPKAAAEKFCKTVPAYWGDKKFTYGGIYVGAIVCFLFLLGLLIVPGAHKWALLAATILSVLLAWGRNFMPLTQFFFDYVPMYNKFRAVESILVIAEITMPLLGFLGLKRIFESEDKKPYRRPLLLAAGVTMAICLFFALFGHLLFDFTSSYDAQWQEKAGRFYDMVLDQRASMLRSDSWRSLIFIALGAGVLWLYITDKLKRGYTYALLGLLIVADMLPIDRRYFSGDNFVSKQQNERLFAIQPWEEKILQDTALDFRVYNRSTKVYKESRTSYRLKSIGGYSAVKLRRYQDLIDEHLSHDNVAVFNMLNTKYIIIGDSIVLNPQAFGNAWFVDSVFFVGTPNEESAALWSTDLRHTAVADEQFADVLTVASPDAATLSDSTEAEIVMTSYAPNELNYRCCTERSRVAVFSEIYYKDGWHLFVDGVEQPIGRVNYVLRAAVIPAGSHALRMYFEPSALQLDKWSLMCIVLVLLISLGSIGWALYRKLR